MPSHPRTKLIPLYPGERRPAAGAANAALLRTWRLLPRCVSYPVARALPNVGWGRRYVMHPLRDPSAVPAQRGLLATSASSAPNAPSTSALVCGSRDAEVITRSRNWDVETVFKILSCRIM